MSKKRQPLPSPKESMFAGLISLQHACCGCGQRCDCKATREAGLPCMGCIGCDADEGKDEDDDGEDPDDPFWDEDPRDSE